ncbi:hypothetical protein D8674_007116 [Pyrus ussuriensis x Pyrus communis]|uniref:Uncharacterized protein n=1 Tax=Pyrus ussuriensis x Pyrus communis TaxID=2448454 RepID=A0A5N5FW99_9ROSA|nr:hypothetical protein D8674_007116 [Pyrus ussuriensis x Pyrus communis]
MKSKLLPHTCSRKGYARLAEDLGNDLPSEASPDTQVAAPEAHVDTVARTETRFSQCATNEPW